MLLAIRDGVPKIQRYNHGQIKSSVQFMNDLFSQKNSIGIFESAQDGIRYYGSLFGYSYEMMNFVLFVVVNPTLILYFVVLMIFFLREKIYLKKKFFLIFTAVFIFITLIMMLPFLKGLKGKISLNTGNPNNIFEFCCDLMRMMAKSTGLSYEEVNIILFLIMQPALVIYSFSIFLLLYIKMKKYEKAHNKFINSGVN